MPFDSFYNFLNLDFTSRYLSLGILFSLLLLMESIFLLCVLNDYLQRYRKYFFTYLILNQPPSISYKFLQFPMDISYLKILSAKTDNFLSLHLNTWFLFIILVYCIASNFRMSNDRGDGWQPWPPSDVIGDAVKFHCYVTHWLFVWDRCSLSCEGNSLILDFFLFFSLKRIINFIRWLFGICSDETILTY